jgi:acetyl-CoA carboxylase carboxyl transferase subunit alpha
VGSPGAYCGITAEERGQGEAIARNLWEMAALEIPILTVVTGEGGSGGALALSVSDKMIMLEDAVYSVVSPEGCATILWKDAGRAKEAAELLRLTSEDLRQLGVADAVLEEAGKSPEQIAKELKKLLIASLKDMDKIRISVLLASRYQRYRKIGNLWG